MSWPCTECGACCSWCRVIFTEDQVSSRGGTVPDDLVLPWTEGMVQFKGTHTDVPRCEALRGTIGEEVGCAIYEKRPWPCRVFEASWEHGQPNRFCDEARFVHGLAPLEPEEWHELR